MRLIRLDVKGIEREAVARGWTIESRQNGVNRVVIDGVVIDSGSVYTALEISIPAPPEMVKRHRLTLAVPSAPEVVIGDFEDEYEAQVRGRELEVHEKYLRIDVVEVAE